MPTRPPPAGPSLVRWLVDVFLDAGKRVEVLLVFAYVAGGAGLAMAFLGAGSPTDRLTAVGVALMFLAFVALFVVSVTLVEVGAAGEERPRRR